MVTAKRGPMPKVAEEVPPGAMVDTNILIHALRVPKKPSERELHRQRSYQRLLGLMQPLRISAISWIEFLRVNPASEHETLTAVASEIQVEAVDREVSERAAVILHRVRGRLDFCRECLAHKGKGLTPARCKLCGMARAGTVRFADAIIVASAVRWKVPVLFTDDSALAANGTRRTAAPRRTRRTGFTAATQSTCCGPVTATAADLLDALWHPPYGQVHYHPRGTHELRNPLHAASRFAL